MSRTRWWHIATEDGEQGMTLVEVLIAVFILSVALLAMASVGTTSLLSLRIARDREHATNAASAAVEAARARDFDALALAATADPTALPTDIQALLEVSGSCAGGEKIVQDGASPDPVPLEDAYDRSPGAVVYTVVTWATPPTPDCTVARSDLKRVVTLATWRDQGRLRSVRNETFVAPVGRGLPVPNFEVKPIESAVSVTPAQADDPAGVEKCIEHQLRNLGANDSYEYDIVEVRGGTGLATLVGQDRWTLSGEWKLRGYLEYPAVDLRGGTPPPDAGVSDALMTDGDLNGMPESDEVVEPRERATITFCYQADSSSSVPLEVDIDVVSRFDERRRERVTHDVAVRDPNVRLYLQDRDHLTTHARDTGAGNEARRYPPYRMNPLNPGSGDQQQELASVLRPWGTEMYASATGLPLRRAVSGSESTRLRTIDFRYSLPNATTLLPGADVRIWASPVTAITTDGTNPRTFTLRFELDVMDAQETGRIWPAAGPIVHEVTYTQNGGGFRERDVELPLTSGVALASDQRLRLRITCVSTSEVDCILGYDTVDHPAYLRVGFQ